VARFQHLAAVTPRPGDVPMSGRPMVGFVGALYEWIDWELIRETARRLPDFDFVLVGPRDRRGPSMQLAGLPNVRLLGARPYALVPAYIDTFDVCWVPFKQDAVGLAANPVKIYEYLALGKPVVTTPVADTDSFGAMVQVARTPGEMAAGLRAAIGGAPAAREGRIAFARQNSWDARAREYVRFIASLA
jgi:glycosyltransferase involved in cell wall biosynthesis